MALLPVFSPPQLAVENRGAAMRLIPIAGHQLQKQREAVASAMLTAALAEQSLKLGDEMTSALLEQLQTHGFEVSVIADAPHTEGDPEDILFDKIATDADVFLVASYAEAGLYSGQFTTDYHPRLNLRVEVLGRKKQDSLHSQYISYGVDARKPAVGQIPADPKYAWGSFDDAMAKRTEVTECYRKGIGAIASQAAQQIRQAGLTY